MFRLEQLAQDIESEYKRFDSWRDKCDNMNQWLTESEKLIKNEDKLGSDIEVLQEQIKDNQVGFKSLYHEGRKCCQLEFGQPIRSRCIFDGIPPNTFHCAPHICRIY